MKAVFIGAFGGPENIQITTLPEPPPPSGREVKIKVRAAGSNRADILQRRGLYPPPQGFSPRIPGLEFAGEIVETGPEAAEWKPGTRVFGITAGEAQAEFLVTDKGQIAEIPERLTFIEAAAVPEAFITAHDALFTQAGLKSGESVLIHAAGSGVGIAAVQLSIAVGAETTGTSRTANKLEKLKDIGLQNSIIIDKGADVEECLRSGGSKRPDVIIDLVGAAYFPANMKFIEEKGRLVLVGLVGGRIAEFDLSAALSKRVKIIGTVLRSRTTAEKADAVERFVKDVVPLLESGKIRPVIDKVFPMEMAADAHRYLESNESFGKVVLEIN